MTYFGWTTGKATGRTECDESQPKLSPRCARSSFEQTALLLGFGNLDSRRDPVRSLFSIGHPQHGTAFSSEALNSLFRAGNLGLCEHVWHRWMVPVFPQTNYTAADIEFEETPESFAGDA